jgi:hypothetical protein
VASVSDAFAPGFTLGLRRDALTQQASRNVQPFGCSILNRANSITRTQHNVYSIDGFVSVRDQITRHSARSAVALDLRVHVDDRSRSA